MEKIFEVSTQSIGSRFLKEAVIAVAGSLFLVLCSQVSIPLYPVPMTMQTFALLVLGAVMGPKRALTSTLLYVAEATIGLPVLAGGLSFPAWMFSPRAGYIIGFPLTAFTAGWLLSRKGEWSAPTLLLSLLLAVALLYICGIAGLMVFFSFEEALSVGLFPFIAPAALQISAAFAVCKGIKRFI